MAIANKRGSFFWIVKVKGRQIWTLTPSATKNRAKEVERECLVAMNSTDFSSLSPEARETLIRFYTKARMEFPPGLRLDEQKESRDFVLWNENGHGAVQLFTSHPIIRKKKQSTRDRYDMSIYHLVRIFKKNFRMKDLWTKQIRDYYDKRIEEGAAPNTIGHEISTLSAIFAVLIDCTQQTGITKNPCDHVRGKNSLSLNFASRRRSAYLSYDLINAITTVWSITTRRPLCPGWLVPILWTGYYTGARLGELLGIKRHQIHLDKRMMYLTPVDQEIKENEPKRIPIHRDLEPTLRGALRIRTIGVDSLFLLSDRRGTRPVAKDTVELAMTRIKKVLNPDPSYSFHDLRHTFRANCSRSGITDRIAERILGHSDKSLSVSERYGEISDVELIGAIDRLVVDNGYSLIDGKPLSLFGNKANAAFEDCRSDSVTENDNSKKKKSVASRNLKRRLRDAKVLL